MDAGLCASCVNVRVIETPRGSRFYRCLAPDLPRYPRLPVVACERWARRV